MDADFVPVFCGAGAGLATTLICSPLDVAKARAQISMNGAYNQGLIGTLKHIRAEEGVRGWYKGIIPAIITVPLFWGIYFPCYEKVKRSASVHLVAAVSAGFAADVVTNPMWVVRTRLQTQFLHRSTEVQYRGFVDAFIQIHRREGPRAFYKGLSASLLGLSHCAIQFPAYERLKRGLREARRRRRRRRGGGGGDEGEEGEGEGRYKDHTFDLIVASAVSKVVGAAVTYPHEVLRTRLQDHRGPRALRLFRTARELAAAGGPGALYRGFGLNLARVVPSCVSTFLAYEYLMRLADAVLPRRSGPEGPRTEALRQDREASKSRGITAPEDVA